MVLSPLLPRYSVEIIPSVQGPPYVPCCRMDVPLGQCFCVCNPSMSLSCDFVSDFLSLTSPRRSPSDRSTIPKFGNISSTLVSHITAVHQQSRSVSLPKTCHHIIADPNQIGIINDASKQPLQQSVSAIVAGSAPTAQLIGQLEQIGIKPVHVYGLT